jgi:predicted nuclease with TOPRIM domain
MRDRADGLWGMVDVFCTMQTQQTVLLKDEAYSALVVEKETLVEEIRLLRQAHAELQGHYHEIICNRDSLQAENVRLNEQRDVQASQFDQLQALNDELQKQHLQGRGDREALQAEVVRLQTCTEKLASGRDASEAERVRLQTYNDELTKSCAQNAELKTGVNEITSDMAQSEADGHLLHDGMQHDEITSLRQKIEHLAAHLAQQEEARVEAEEAVENLSLKIQDVEEALESAQLDLKIAHEEGNTRASHAGEDERVDALWGPVVGDADEKVLRQQVQKLAVALQQVYAAYVCSMQHQQQLADDLEIALEEVVEGDALRARLQELNEHCEDLQEQVDAAEGVAGMLSVLTDKCGHLEEQIESQMLAIAELEEMLQVSEEVEELQMEELRQLQGHAVSRDAFVSQQHLALQLLSHRLLAAESAAQHSRTALADLQCRLDQTAEAQMGVANDAEEKRANLSALYVEQLALEQRLVAMKHHAIQSQVYFMHAKTKDLEYQWLQKFVPPNWQGFDASLVTLLSQLLQLAHALQIICQIRCNGTLKRDQEAPAQKNGSVSDDGIAGEDLAGSAAHSGEAGALAKCGELADLAQRLVVELWCFDGAGSGAGSEGVVGMVVRGHGVSSKQADVKTGETDARGEACASKTLEIACGYAGDIADLVAAIEDVLLAGDEQGARGDDADWIDQVLMADQIASMAAAADKLLTELEAHLVVAASNMHSTLITSAVSREELEQKVRSFLHMGVARNDDRMMQARMVRKRRHGSATLPLPQGMSMRAGNNDLPGAKYVSCDGVRFLSSCEIFFDDAFTLHVCV